MASFKTYEEAARYAQANADTSGFDYGVEKLGREWRAWMLPAASNRFGHERACEVRHCAHLDRVRPGHGPNARSA